MDRTSTKTTDFGTAKQKTTRFNYLGLTDKVLDEEVAGEIAKTYQYSPWGERLSQVKHNADGTEEDGFYGYNSHTDVEQLTAELVAGGMTPDEARHAARREVGNLPLLAEQCRDVRRVGWLLDLRQDVAFAMRMLLRHPAATFVIVSSLAIGVMPGRKGNLS